jgi:hypothetical protein
VLLWIDLHIPATAAAGEHAGSIDLLRDGAARPIASLPISLLVHNFNLPNERHLQMIGRLAWDRLEKLYPDRFEAVTPDWVNRQDPKYAQTVKTLDQLMAVAEHNRLALFIPALRAITKWPAGAPPENEWRDFDSLVGPWLEGQTFADHVALRFWPLPPAEMLDRYDRPSQLQYWSQAAAHFDQKKWLGISPVSLDSPGGDGNANADSRELSVEAAQILRTHPNVRVMMPLTDDQIQLAGPQSAALIDPPATSRLLTASPPLISKPAPPWPAAAARPEHWLRTDLPGFMPYFGAGGDERDMRLWAWLAFLRQVPAHANSSGRDETFILWNDALPSASGPAQAADPGELVWFYPGSWFGIDQPVPTIQLKWLRRAEQDYEYLQLAKERGEAINTLQMARLLARPIEIQPDQAADPVYALMSGNTDPRIWDEAQQLLIDSILLHSPGTAVDPARQQELYLRTMQWAAPRERPLMLARSAEWSPGTSPTPRDRSTWMDLKLGLDIYNASETAPDQNRLAWSAVPPGWQIQPQELAVPRLSTFHVTRVSVAQKFNLSRLSSAARQPIELQFTDGFHQTATALQLVLPVAACDRREGKFNLDGNLDDWLDSDPIQSGPLVRMFTRPAIQKQELQFSSAPTRLYCAWARENLYLAFSLQGISTHDGASARNFVEYQQRRAWGEDLCEILIQPLDANGAAGSVLHVICKPNGAVIVERKAVNSNQSIAWQSVEGAAVRYASNSPKGAWDGEIAIPWSLIAGQTAQPPPFLRFNFTQHHGASGESASWAGPLDYGRDDAFMGLLYVRGTNRQSPGAVVGEP